MSRRESNPPLYFFGTMLLNFSLYWMLKDYTILHFPFNLSGLFLLIPGFLILRHSSNLFRKRSTTYLLETPANFVEEGLFRYSRNPMYLGGVLFATGVSFLLGNAIGFVCPIILILLVRFISIRKEEILMEKTFGDAYLKYKNEVRRWI